MQTIKRMLSFGNVVAVMAIFLAMSGAAIAGSKAAKNSVTTQAIKNGTVTGKDVRNESLTGADINEATLALADETRPSGAAGGDLTGSYPNPQIGPNAVGPNEISVSAVTGAKIADDTINGEDIVEDAVGTSELADAAVGSSNIATASVTNSKLALDSVGSLQIGPGAVGGSELRGMLTVTSEGVDVSAGTPRNQVVTCPQGTKVVGGGYSWFDDEANSIIVNAPSETNPNRTWEVRGMVAAGSNTLYAWANCVSA